MRSLAFAAIVLTSGAAAGGCLAQTRIVLPPVSQDFAALDEAAFAAHPMTRIGSTDIALPQTRRTSLDSLRVSVGEVVAPTGQTLFLDRAQYDAKAIDVSLLRDWPAAFSFDAGKLGVDLSPHAGVGMGSRGGSAEAGARVELSKRRDDQAVQRLRDLGVREGEGFGDRGRWYLFAAASGRAVGLNMLRNENGWDHGGWTTDPTSTLVGDAQVGVGWRKGDLQTSFGYMHREVKGDHMIFGQQTREDSMLAFTLSIKPGR